MPLWCLLTGVTPDFKDMNRRAVSVMSNISRQSRDVSDSFVTAINDLALSSQSGRTVTPYNSRPSSRVSDRMASVADDSSEAVSHVFAPSAVPIVQNLLKTTSASQAAAIRDMLKDIRAPSRMSETSERTAMTRPKSALGASRTFESRVVPQVKPVADPTDSEAVVALRANAVLKRHASKLGQALRASQSIVLGSVAEMGPSTKSLVASAMGDHLRESRASNRPQSASAVRPGSPLMATVPLAVSASQNVPSPALPIRPSSAGVRRPVVLTNDDFERAGKLLRLLRDKLYGRLAAGPGELRRAFKVACSGVACLTHPAASRPRR